MNRIQEKVKDIVEVRKYVILRDFAADAVETLSNYHFTDVTSELMAKWLDRIANVQSHGGAAFALAGYRGVGKSHFLATLAALVSQTELRTKVTDSHVASSAQRLLRRHYPVVQVRRGTSMTLIEELKAAVSEAFSIDENSVGDSVQAIFETVGTKTGDLPYLMLIDTAFERGARVARDDGTQLSEIAEAIKTQNVFVGVALDDDIAGADGTNSAISRTFTIDYLDQEHLYKVVNSHIFPKQPQMQPVLQEIYQYFREVLPNFRWSEQKFTSLYPLHPAILEVAPYVRLYVHDFALLGFASEAGERIMGRPATSLIALDEVFDKGEQGLRKIEDLNEAFAVYDELNSEVVAKIPVMQRLQAKLILKALMLLSLDGQGTTAAEIAQSMLIFDESDPGKAATTVEDLIKTFADAMPNDVQCISVEGRETRYGFKVASKDKLNIALDLAISDVPVEELSGILRRLMNERFQDFSIPVDDSGDARNWMDCGIYWRGGHRRGRINWNYGNPPDTQIGGAEANDSIDWVVSVETSISEPGAPPAKSENAFVSWKPDELTREEIEILLRYHVLLTNADIRTEFDEQVRPSLHSHLNSAGRILQRSFLEDGKLVIDGFDYNFTEEARGAQTLSELYTAMLDPLFETRFPDHPEFGQKLGMAEVATLVTDLYSGTRQNLAEVQNLARDFALPLGLVRKNGDLLEPESVENLLNLPIVAAVGNITAAAVDQTVSLKSVYTTLRKPPFGLAREAQHLVLAALVGARQLEFVTSKGDRISRRSLDLKIIWDDIVGVAKPIESVMSAKRLLKWAKVFTGDAEFSSFENSEHLKVLEGAFEQWIAEWRKNQTLEKFENVPDEILNTRIWRMASSLTKTLGSIAPNISSAVAGQIGCEECLNRVADIFSDSEDEFARATNDLAVLESFAQSLSVREEIATYLAVSDVTSDTSVEENRGRLMEALEVNFADPNEDRFRAVGYLWAKFQRSYSELFATQHDLVMRSHYLKEKYDEIMASDKWWEFENLSRMPGFDRRHWRETVTLRRQVSRLVCDFDPRESLKFRPFCSCSFTVVNTGVVERLPGELWQAIGNGLENYREELARKRNTIVPLIDAIASDSKDAIVTAAANNLSKLLSKGKALPQLSNTELDILRKALNAANFESFEDSKEEELEIEIPTNLQRESAISSEPADEAILIQL